MAINNNSMGAANLVVLYLATQNILLDVEQISQIAKLIESASHIKDDWSQQDNILLKENNDTV